ncbi:MAG: hypothetical protein AB7P02_03490 [Alphaproteobacteria bacterium]
MPPDDATNGEAAAYLLLLYAHARLLEERMRAISGWAAEARRIGGSEP